MTTYRYMTPYDRAWDMAVYTEYMWSYDGICQVVRIPDASHRDSVRDPLCPNSISVLLCLQSVLTTVYCQMLTFGTTFVHLILIEFKEHFKLVVFLGIRVRTRTSDEHDGHAMMPGPTMPVLR